MCQCYVLNYNTIIIKCALKKGLSICCPAGSREKDLLCVFADVSFGHHGNTQVQTNQQ